ncbi:phosphate ABC transporter permease PstA [Planctomycetes bacterium K23_9]|uniref:Phosphate transport system permease protein PstA n=1 Tax=Stieleria marina TaxID=1930275 RepID=A0A517NVH6_9BACT|nr:Phosphate transport system permease protein PstA [Planctomycetes bacterium K23_9]
MNSLTDRLVSLMIGSAAALVAAVLGWVLLDILYRGIGDLSWEFLAQPPEDAGRSGGIAPIIVSTMLILMVALIAAVPLSLSAAAALAQQRHRRFGWAWIASRCLDVLAAVPSVVFGLFGNAFFCVALGMGYSILAGGLTLACMILPILIHTTEHGLRAVPADYHYAAASLGLSRTTTFFRITLPAALPAIAAGLVLGIGRALAETAALIFTAGYVTRQPESLMGSGRSMSVHIFDMAMNVPAGDGRANATAALLVAMLLIINAAAMSLASKASAKLSGQTAEDMNSRQYV